MRKKKVFDCGEEGCGECEVCKHLDFLDWAYSVAPAGSTIERKPEIDKYLKEKSLSKSSNL